MAPVRWSQPAPASPSSLKIAQRRVGGCVLSRYSLCQHARALKWIAIVFCCFFELYLGCAVTTAFVLWGAQHVLFYHAASALLFYAASGCSCMAPDACQPHTVRFSVEYRAYANFGAYCAKRLKSVSRGGPSAASKVYMCWSIYSRICSSFAAHQFDTCSRSSVLTRTAHRKRASSTLSGASVLRLR